MKVVVPIELNIEVELARKDPARVRVLPFIESIEEVATPDGDVEAASFSEPSVSISKLEVAAICDVEVAPP